MTHPQKPRPGGRNARIRADVLRAAVDLMAEQSPAQLTLPQVAERAGVHVGTVYRRWGSLDGLMLDAVSEMLSGRSPVRDTGDLRADLEDYARGVAKDLSGVEGGLFLRLLATVRPGAGAPLPPALVQRFEQVQELLDRAAARGEWVPTMRDVVEFVVAPLVAALLFGTEPTAPPALVGRLLAQADARR